MAEDKGEQTLNELVNDSINPEGSGGVDSEESWNQGGLGESSTPENKPQIDPEGSNEENTVLDVAEEEASKPESPEKPGEEKPEKTPDGEADRFDKHPRFQELNTKVGTLANENQKLQGMVDALLKTNQPTPEKVADPTYRDVTEMTDEELQNEFDESPKAFMANFAQQLKSELTNAITAESAQAKNQTDAQGHIGKFAEKNPEFLKQWNSGEVQKVMNQYPKGFHNPISAYYELSETGTEKTVQGRIDTAVKEAEKKVTDNFKAKRRIVSIDGGAAPKNSAPDQDLQDTKKSGGLVSAITERIMRGRQAA